MINKMSILKKSMVGGLAISFMILFAINASAWFSAPNGDPKKKGDVVGRLGGGGDDKLEHLGLYDITSRGGVIIQIIGEGNNAHYDRTHTVINFKSMGSGEYDYWGAKYVGNGTADLLYVVKAANDQINSYPQIDYATAHIAIPGQVVWKYKWNFWKFKWVAVGTEKIKPKFRCETFVNWAHIVGNNQELVPTTKSRGRADTSGGNYSWDEYIYTNVYGPDRRVFDISTALKGRPN